jgi:hypothetical protein
MAPAVKIIRLRKQGSRFAKPALSGSRAMIPLEVAKRLRAGTPSIELNPATGSTEASAGIPSDPNKIVVGVWMLEPGEDAIVARRLP